MLPPRDSQAPDSARDDRELLERIVDTIPVMITVYEPGTRVVRVNHEFERLLGWVSDEVAGTSLMEACYPDPDYRRQVADFMSSCSGRWMDIRMRARDGHDVDTSWANIRLSDDRLVGIGIDISERKASEQALRELDRRKDEFVATLAHELRNPLAPIRSALDVLRLGEDSRDARARACSILERQVAQMTQLVDDLLDLSRIRHGTIPMRRHPVTLQSVIASVVESTGPGLRAGGHELDVRLPEADVWLDADPARLEQSVVNLVNNACAYSAHGSPIRIQGRIEPRAAVLEVIDEGRGIPSEMRSRIFDMFARGETAAEAHPTGLGIGLALARIIVELHGGRIEVRSEIGSGSCFAIHLPLPDAGGPGAAGA